MVSILLFVLATLTTPPAHADVAGNWRVEFVVPTGELTVTMTINQDGTKLTGRVINEDGEFPLEGTGEALRRMANFEEVKPLIRPHGRIH